MLTAWLAITLWSNGLYLRAALDPPAGKAFAGTFHWIDDFYHYVSYAQQAEDGQLLLRNKLADLATARPLLVNLEWWALGGISRALGRRPFLAYRVLGALAALALTVGAERWLARLGVPATHRLAALVLVLFGGGLGGILFESTDLAVQSCFDLSVGAYPFLQLLANPHFALGTALLLWSLWCFAEVPSPAGPAIGVALGTVLGLVRPYDLGLLGLIRGAAVLASEPPRRWVRALAPLLGLLPVLGYDLWVFIGTPEYAQFRVDIGFPTVFQFASGLGPAFMLALLAARERDPGSRRVRVHLWCWIGLTGVLFVVRPPAFSAQLFVGAGLPLLLLGASGLRRFAPDWTALAALCLATSAVAETRIMLRDDPNWFVPRERIAAAMVLRGSCGPSDRVLAPPDVSLYTIGLSACSAFVAHPLAPEYGRQLTEARAFYGEMSPEARSRMLETNHITRLVLPGFAGPRAIGWLGPATAFEVAAVVGSGPRTLSVYAAPSRMGRPQTDIINSR